MEYGVAEAVLIGVGSGLALGRMLFFLLRVGAGIALVLAGAYTELYSLPDLLPETLQAQYLQHIGTVSELVEKANTWMAEHPELTTGVLAKLALAALGGALLGARLARVGENDR